MTTEPTTGSQPTAPRGSQRSRREILTIDAAIVLAGIPLLISGLRLLVVSNGEEAILKPLARTINIQALLLGTYLTVFPTLIMFLAIIYFLTAYPMAQKPPDKVDRRTVLSITIGLFVFALLLTPRRFSSLGIVVLGLITVCFLVVTERSTRKWKSSDVRIKFFRQSVKAWAVIGGILLLVGSIFPTGMWLPSEEIALMNGQKKIGFVLEADEDEITILWKNGGGVELLKRNSVDSRRICRSESFDGDPLVFSLVFGDTVATRDISTCPG